MNHRGSVQRPIGYWLKRADEAITEHVNKALSDYGFTRSRWQVLNLIHQAGIVAKDSVLEEMRDFVSALELDEILEALETRGWVTGSTPLELTEAGREGHADVLRVQTEVRKRAVLGVSEDEYATVVRVLARIVTNLEGEPHQESIGE